MKFREVKINPFRKFPNLQYNRNLLNVKGEKTAFFFVFVCFDALHPSQRFFSHMGMISCLPGLNQQIKCFA